MFMQMRSDVIGPLRIVRMERASCGIFFTFFLVFVQLEVYVSGIRKYSLQLGNTAPPGGSREEERCMDSVYTQLTSRMMCDRFNHTP